MTDRCVVAVKYGDHFAACAMYLHWDGSKAIDWLKEAIPGMSNEDENYSMARLIGFCHTKLKGNRFLGVTYNKLDDLGDAGYVEYDCETGIIHCRNGYHEEHDGEQLPVPPRRMDHLDVREVCADHET